MIMFSSSSLLIIAAHFARNFKNTIDQPSQIFALVDGNLGIKAVGWSSAGTFATMHPAAAIWHRCVFARLPGRTTMCSASGLHGLSIRHG
jgi:hypothetical protein